MSFKNTRMIQSDNCVYTTVRKSQTINSLPGVVLSLNNNVFSNKYLSANVTVLTTALPGGNVLHTKYKLISLKLWTGKIFHLDLLHCSR